jgi:uncharacterized protein with HEPN domain
MRRDDAYLLDILLAAQRAQKHIKGVSRDDFQSNEMLQDALIRPLEIIGEAAQCISDEFKEQHSEIPWFKMTGMRNRLIHEYFRVDYGAVWDTVRKDVPELINLIKPLVPEDTGE